MTYPEARYLSAGGEVSAAHRPHTLQPDLAGPNATVHYLATGATTAGQLGLYRYEMGSQPSGPSPHFHRTISESFFVLTGAVRLYDGEGWVEAAPGDFLHVPQGGIHAFRNESGAPATLLLLFTPGAPREAYFEELADIARTSRTLTSTEWTDLYARHDQHMV